MWTVPVLLPISDSISQAWKFVHGIKAAIWKGILLMILISVGFMLIGKMFAVLWPEAFLMQVSSGIGSLILFLMSFGMVYIAIQRTYGRPVSYRMVYQPFDMSFVWRLIVVIILEAIILLPISIITAFFPLIVIEITKHVVLTPLATKALIIAIVVICVFVILYLSVRMMLTVFFLLDTTLRPWQCIKSSFLATRSNFWRILCYFVISMLLYFLLTVLTLGIGAIWAIPFLYTLHANLYQRLKVNAEA